MSPSSRKLMDDILTNLLELEVGGSDKNNDDNNSNILVAADVDEQPVRKRKPFQSVQQRFEQRLQLQQEQAADSKESLWIQCDFCGEMIYRAIFQGHIIQHEPINILHQLYYHELGEEKRQRERIEQFHRKQAAKEQRRQQRRLDKPAGSCTSSMASGSSSTSSSDDSSNSSTNSRRPSMSPEYGEGDDEREEEGEENDGMATISSTQHSRKRRERAWEKRPGKKQLPVTKQRKPNNNKPPISKPASVRKRSTAQNKSSNPPKPRKRNRNAHPFAHRPRKRRNFVKTEPLAGIMAEWTTAAEPAVKWEPTMALEAGSGKQRIRMDRPLLEHLLCMKNLGPNYDQVFVDLRKQRIVIDRQGRVPNPVVQNAEQPMEQQPQQLAPKRRRSTRGALAADFSGSDDMTLVCLL